MSPRNTLPIIVGGCHRSGTTLVRRILNAHPAIFCGPELKFFRDFHGDYLQDPLAHLRYARTARAILPEEELLEILGGAFVELHRRAAQRAGKRRWADKNPENVLYLGDWERLLGDAWLFVHVVRNPLDTLVSMIEHPFPLTLPPDLRGRVEFYRRYNEAGLAFEQRAPDRYFRIRYEQLVATPGETIAALMSWMGEPFDPAQLALGGPDQPRGLEDPKSAGRSEISTSSVGRWRTELPEADADIVWRETRDLWMRLDPENRYSPR